MSSRRRAVQLVIKLLSISVIVKLKKMV